MLRIIMRMRTTRIEGALTILLVVALLLVVVAHTATAATAAAAENNNNNNQKRKVISIPLIPHHVQKERRLDVSDVSTRRNLQKRPEHYYRFKNNNNNNVRHHRRDTHTGAISTKDPEAAVAEQVAGLFQGYGTHYADLWCGTPPQRQTVIVDTGSGVTAFPCQGCSDCGVPQYHIDALFDQSASSTYHELTCDECLKGTCRNSGSGGGGQCSIGMSYQEGSSWNAIEAQDLCYVGGFHDRPVNDDGVTGDDLDPFHAEAFAFDMKFGCQTKLTGLFKTQLADGIMGMDVAPAAFWWQMYAAHKIDHKAFSLCFSRQPSAARNGTEAGAMSLGGSDERLHSTPMVYSATQQSSGFYVVRIRKVYLRPGGGGTSAQSKQNVVQLDISESSLNSGRVIVDSGTTDTYFSRKLGAKFKTAYKEMTGQEYSHSAKKFTPEQLAQEPTILFQLAGDEDLNQAVQGRSTTGETVVGLAGNELDSEHPLDVVLAIPPEHYYEYDPEEEGYVSRFYVDEGSGGVFGANSMMGHDVYFDVTSYRVGWAESDCDYSSLVQRYTDGDWTAPPKPPRPVVPQPSDSHDSNDGGDATGQLDNDDYTPPPDPYDQPGFCSGLGCQIAVLAGVVVAVVLMAVRLVRRAPMGPSYDLAGASELELRQTDDLEEDDDGSFVNAGQQYPQQPPTSADVAGGATTNGVQYRDHESGELT